MPKLTIDAEKLKHLLILLAIGSNTNTGNLFEEAFPEVKEEKWKPKKGEYFFSIGSDISVVKLKMPGSDVFFNSLIESGNCFRTQEECQTKIEEIKKLLAK